MEEVINSLMTIGFNKEELPLVIKIQEEEVEVETLSVQTLDLFLLINKSVQLEEKEILQKQKLFLPRFLAKD